jgi:membrane protease subunit HflC
MKRLLFILLPLALLAWGVTALYPVDYAEYAYVTRFGQPVAALDGETAAGLHVKLPWPIDSVARIDRRVQAFDLPAVEALTRDPKRDTIDTTVTVDAFITWRVPDAAAADQFVRAVGTPDQVKKLLAPQVSGRLAAVVGGMSLNELASEPGVDPLAGLTGTIGVAEPSARARFKQAQSDRRAEVFHEKLLADGFVQKVREQYGVEVVTLRLRRLTFPEAVRASIYERIRSERRVKVDEYENEGMREANRIRTEADQKRRETEATARAEKQRIEGAADVLADQLRNEAHAKDPEFYAFLQRLKAMQAVLADSRDVLLLSLNHELFRLLKEAPTQPNK